LQEYAALEEIMTVRKNTTPKENLADWQNFFDAPKWVRINALLMAKETKTEHLNVDA
jgi:hypothetical protein